MKRMAMSTPLREEFLRIAKELEASPLASLGPGKGSISARCLEEPALWMTPSGMKFSRLGTSDLVKVGLDGEILEGFRKPSLDVVFHRAIYVARPDVGAVVHTHSPYATAWACLGEPIQPMILALVLLVGGSVDIAPFAFPQTPELGEAVVEALGQKNAVLMANHGVVCVGKNLAKALACASTVENVAQIQAIAASIGALRPLEPQVVQKGLAMESGYGQTAVSAGERGC